jgi:hypothetical protein
VVSRLAFLLAPLLFLELAIALLGALESFGRAHWGAHVAKQSEQATDEYGADDDQGDDELGHGNYGENCVAFEVGWSIESKMRIPMAIYLVRRQQGASNSDIVGNCARPVCRNSAGSRTEGSSR